MSAFGNAFAACAEAQQIGPMSLPGLVEQIDDAAAELLADESQSYEAGVWIASAAADFVGDATVGEAAELIRDTFGTWVELMHTHGHVNGSTVADADAEGAHRGIAAAASDWTNGGRDDPRAFGERWRAAIAPVDNKVAERWRGAIEVG